MVVSISFCMIRWVKIDNILLLHIILIIDYDSAGYSVTIGARGTEGSENITIIEDNVPGEGDETFTNRIESVSTAGVTLEEGESVVTIMDSTSENKINIKFCVLQHGWFYTF